MGKKNLIEEALIEARELEAASIENAKDVVLETFKPDFVEFFKDVLNESEESEDDDEDEVNEEDLYEEDEEDEDEDEVNETDHDMGKLEDDDDETTHDLGKGFTNEEYYLEEGEYDDVDGDPTPESEEYLPAEDRPKVKKVGKSGWEDEGSAGYDMSGPENGKSPMPGGTPKAKQTGESGWEDEGYYTTPKKSADPEKGGKNGLDNVPTAKIVRELNRRGILEDEDINVEDLVYENEDLYEEEDHEEPDGDEDEDGEESDHDEDLEEGMFYGRSSGIFEEEEEDSDEKDELDVPDELFDDEDDEDSDSDEEDEDSMDEDVDIDIEDEEEDEDDDLDEEVDLDVDDEEDDDEDESVNEEEDDDEDEDEVNENLYIRENGRFMKITPAEYLNNRIETLKEENEDLLEFAEELQGRLYEANLFNAKLAHMNKLFMSEAFTNNEKTRIAEKLDECESIADVKSLYNTIISEVQEMNPLDDFSRVIKEQRISTGKAKTENIYESNDVSRMRQLINYKTD